MLLLQHVLVGLLEREDFEKLNRLADSEEAVGDESAALLVQLKEALSSRHNLTTVEGLDGSTLSETQIIATGTVDTGEIDGDIGRSRGLNSRFKKYLKAMSKSDRWHEVTQRSYCVACRQQAVNPYISDCYHIYCFSWVISAALIGIHADYSQVPHQHATSQRAQGPGMSLVSRSVLVH